MRPQLKDKSLFEDSDHGLANHNSKAGIPADSAEIRYGYYSSKIQSLEAQLNKLTLLEHPCEIKALCSQIIQIKKNQRYWPAGIIFK